MEPECSAIAASTVYVLTENNENQRNTMEAADYYT